MVQKTIPKQRAAKSADRIGLLVVGMHRSGTSAVTKTISLLGADLPKNLMPAHAEFNAAGYWESQDVVDLNDHLLTAIGSCWDDVLPVDVEKIPSEALQEFNRQAAVILNRDFKECRWFVLKDPRIGRLLRLWIPAVETHGASPRVIIPIRHPLEVAASLHRREGFSEDKSVYLWLRHVVDAIRDSRNVPRAIILYDELMQDWRTAVERLGRDVNVTWQKDLDEAAPLIEQFLDQKLRHHAVGGIRYQSGKLIDRLAAELYAALCNRANDLEHLVDSIHEQLVPLEAVFAPLLQDAGRRLDREFETKCRHVEQLQQLVTSEREVYQRLDNEFKAKMLHLQLVQDQLTKAESDFAKLDREFETKCRHVEQLQQLVASERDVHRRLEEEFGVKIQHNVLLAEEITELTAHLQHAQKKVANAENELASLGEQKICVERAIKDVTEKIRMAVLLRPSE